MSKTKPSTVAANKTKQALFKLKAGRIKVTPTSVAKTVNRGRDGEPGRHRQNTGGAPATVTLGEQPGGSTMLTAHGAPIHRVKGKYSPRSLHAANGATGEGDRRKAAPNATPADAPWTSIANFPVTIQDNGVAR